MKNDIQNREVTVLLVSDNASDIQEVNKHLEETMGMTCRFWHCPGIARSMGFFKDSETEVDVVLLDLGLVASGEPREIFRRMQDIVGSTPIIVFTERENHELALMVIDEGAADNVTRGQFSTDPFKLRDAIEFSLARQRVADLVERKSAKVYRSLEKKGAVDLQELKDHEKKALKEGLMDAEIDLAYAVEQGKDDLKDAIERCEQNLKDTRDEAAATLKQTRKDNIESHREKDQIISWMGGGYSVEKNSGAK